MIHKLDHETFCSYYPLPFTLFGKTIHNDTSLHGIDEL